MTAPAAVTPVAMMMTTTMMMMYHSGLSGTLPRTCQRSRHAPAYHTAQLLSPEQVTH